MIPHASVQPLRVSFAVILLTLAAAQTQGQGKAADPPAIPATAPATVPAAAVSADRLAGNWLGALKVGAIELRVGLKLTAKDGKLTGTFDSIDQGAHDLPVDAVTVEGTKLTFTMVKLLGGFVGNIDPGVTTIDGTWVQAGQKMPLTLKRVDAMPTVRRPQEPKKPYPYREEEVTFPSAPGVRLAGTLTLPKGKGPFPAVVLITGSGPQDRDEFLMGHRPFLVLSDHLTRAGISVLRYDDRGIAQSTGTFATATDDDFVVDALAGITYLKGRSEIDPKKIGLVGHSEGGVVGPMAAVKAPGDVAFVVMLAGVGVPMEELLIRQGADIMRSVGIPDDLNKRFEPMRREMFKLLRGPGEPAELEKQIKALSEHMLASLNAKEREIIEKLGGGATEGPMTQMLLTPWFRQLLRYDPAPTLEKVKCPVLAINGERDLQVSPKENLAGIKASLEKGGNRDVQVAQLPGLNHLFQHCNTGSVSEYAKIEETFAPEAMEKVSAWIRAHVGQ